MTKRQLLIAGIICLVILTIVIPIETTIIPKWRPQVVDVNGVASPSMRVTQHWRHYRLYVGGNDSSEDRYTDLNGYVEFPARSVRAGLLRRTTVPIVTRITTIVHGGWDISGAVWATGIKDVAWLSYHSDKPLPDKMRVEKCSRDRE